MPASSLSSPREIRFGVFEVDAQSRELRKKGFRIKIQQQPFELLLILLSRPGEVVSREELRLKLWPADVYIDFDRGLNKAMVKLREALGDSSDSPLYIETLPRLGYRFIGPMNRPPPASESWPPVAKLTSPPTNLPEPEATAPSSGSTSAQTSLPPVEESLNDRDRRRSRVLALLFLLLAGAATGLAVRGPASSERTPLGMRQPLLPSTKPQIQALAVLPLANLSGNPGQEYFADGMTQALITELGKASAPRVVSRQSVMQYKSSSKSLQEIARELRVDAILEGSVERAGDQVKVSVHLFQASPETLLWATDYKRGIRDVLRIQNDIAVAVTDQIRGKLPAQPRDNLRDAHSISPQAHDDYLHGRYLLTMILEAHTLRTTDLAQLQVAVWYFKQAIAEDPTYAVAYAGLADAFIVTGDPSLGGRAAKEILPDAKAAATKAVELDPALAEAHFSLAQVAELFDWNWSEAERQYQLALHLNPNLADAHLQYGRFLQAMGRDSEVFPQLEYATQLDPLNTFPKRVVSYVTYSSRQYDLSIKEFEDTHDNLGLAWAYREKGLYPEAGTMLERHIDQDARRTPVCISTLAQIYGLAGRKTEALQLIAELKDRSRIEYVSGVFFAQSYLGLGERDLALAWLERAYKDHDPWMVYVAAYPTFDPLHSEPRFQALLRRMHFPPHYKL
jgi:TolB-like protein/DNA-binding winged helix-turn-helix (wHTH) protein